MQRLFVGPETARVLRAGPLSISPVAYSVSPVSQALSGEAKNRTTGAMSDGKRGRRNASPAGVTPPR